MPNRDYDWASPRGRFSRPYRLGPIAVSVDTVQAILESLRSLQLLTPAQLAEVARQPSGLRADPRDLGKELLRRGWLTPFQVNQVMAGRAADLRQGPYLIVERLGEGGVGQVFKATHQAMRRTVALKVLRKELLADAEAVQRFSREMQLASRLSHPNIIRAYDAGPLSGTLAIAIEYLQGIDLDRRVRQSGPLPLLLACDYIRQASLGLQHAHEAGLVHRDIKPSNLFLCQAGPGAGSDVVKILDFGLARLRLPVAGSLTHQLTLRNGQDVTMGTPDYLAPEQALDFHGADTRADIYSLGCTFYFLLTGQPPFPGGTLAEKLVKHQQVEPPSARQFRADLTAHVEQVLLRMIAKRPEDRWQTPAEIARALVASSDGEKPLLVETTPGKSDHTMAMRLIPPLSSPARRRWFPVTLLVSGLFVLLTVPLVGFLLFGGRPEKAAASRTTTTIAAVAAPTATPAVPVGTSAAGAGNLVRNPGFESGMEGWLSWGGFNVVKNSAHSGRYAAAVGPSGGAEQAPPISAAANGTYVLSAWGKLVGGQDTEVGFVGYRLLNAGGQILGKDTYMEPFGREYRQKSLTFQTTADTASILVIMWHNPGTGILYVDDISLTKK